MVSKIFDVLSVVLFIVFIGYGLKFVKNNLRLNIFFGGGWGNLEQAYSVPHAPHSISLRSTSARVGLTVFKNTMNIALDETGVYLQRSFFIKNNVILHIPYHKMILVEKRNPSWAASGFGIFTVDGVDVWIDQPYANQILEKLRP